jgi:hypothetical protein
VRTNSSTVIEVCADDPVRELTVFKDGMLPSDFFRRNVVLIFQEDTIGIRLRDVHRCRQHDVGLGLSAQ